MSEEDLENGIETNIIVLLDFYKPIKLIENTRSEVSSFEFAIDDFENIPEDVKAKAVFGHPRTILNHLYLATGNLECFYQSSG